ncbi:YhcN/YlaJ family sporulation lipoprotein [Alteribacillus bidgolensis]|uniref:Sporulation lipoprotein YhcN/YlaJ (Spore_YhcN_YlaJ) n=1 Tax=Alteribacillus bidgolensis TaxID=930129 RepID=A0A1G8CT11_9BACI|nr:YhcN/YlaJ family sporulation lipoprotein [Alteribacillus bidgolensis]SDH48464.1 Sporulation lipoprotein YhcN/YlaJ (Spore_YhcN_YlaJ) [Alteribacillus bidgolensis]
MKTLNFLLLIILVLSFGSGCTENQDQLSDNGEPTKINTTKPKDQSLSNQVKEFVIEKDEITDVKAVNTENELLLAIKVGQFERFQIKSIEEEVKSDLEKKYPNKTVDVSIDQKIIWELGALEDKLQKDEIKVKELKEDIKRIKDLMKEKT